MAGARPRRRDLRAACVRPRAGWLRRQAGRTPVRSPRYAPARRQVGQVPPGPLLGGGDHAATACRSRLPPGRRRGRPRRPRRPHGQRRRAPECIRRSSRDRRAARWRRRLPGAASCASSTSFPRSSCSFHDGTRTVRRASGTAVRACSASRFAPRRSRPAGRRRGAERLRTPAAATTAGRGRRERTGRRGRGRRRGCGRARRRAAVRRLRERRSRAGR